MPGVVRRAGTLPGRSLVEGRGRVEKVVLLLWRARPFAFMGLSVFMAGILVVTCTIYEYTVGVVEYIYDMSVFISLQRLKSISCCR